MNIQFYHIVNGDASLLETEGSITLTYDHLWDKSGKQPILLAWFNGDYWIREDTGHEYTDVEISNGMDGSRSHGSYHDDIVGVRRDDAGSFVG